MVNKSKDTERQILEAARMIFLKKGLKGARMQEIADLAKINKAMLHYYFRSKDQLFQSVYANAFTEVSKMMNEIFESDLAFFDKIRMFVKQYSTFVIQNPNLPAFIINEAIHNPDFSSKVKADPNRPNPQKFLMQIQQEVEKGSIRPIHPVQLMTNIISLCVFPVISRKMQQTISQLDDQTYNAFLDSRKTEVAEFIINAIKL